MSKKKPSPAKPSGKKQDPPQQSHATREFIESVVIAIILAFLFRAFEAEAFVIPTGSMAPTLMGRHKDLACLECGQPYQATASSENTENPQPKPVVATTCPTCRYTMPVDPYGEPNHASFSGDRILVSKFAFELAEPERWNVIVFKYPGNAKQNYIKRLVGLPGESIRIRHGDVYIKRPGDTEYRIATRGPDKILAMLQLVHDNNHQSETLNAIGWPLRWRDESADSLDEAQRWQASDDRRSYRVEAPAGEPASLRYRHTIANADDWEAISDLNSPPSQVPSPEELAGRRGQLITDFCAYNAVVVQDPRYYASDASGVGAHWVGDVAMELTVAIEQGQGLFRCEIVEAGAHYRAEFDLAAGKLSLSRGDREAVFRVAGERLQAVLEARSPITGPGTYQIRMANVDDAICVWVDGTAIAFDGVGQVAGYRPPTRERPQWSVDDPGDLAPLRISAEGLTAEVSNLKVLRDVYYVALHRDIEDNDDYDGMSLHEEILYDPATWDDTRLFPARRTVQFDLVEDEFFPLGDNSPQSLDGRLWDVPPAPRTAIPRELMIGKALFVYWPHTWKRPLPFTPNPQKMRLIR